MITSGYWLHLITYWLKQTKDDNKGEKEEFAIDVKPR